MNYNLYEWGWEVYAFVIAFVFILGFTLGFAAFTVDDYILNEKEHRAYCDRVIMYEETGGMWGWNNFQKRNCSCVS
mgnify:CR=1 FL=1